MLKDTSVAKLFFPLWNMITAVRTYQNWPLPLAPISVNASNSAKLKGQGLHDTVSNEAASTYPSMRLNHVVLPQLSSICFGKLALKLFNRALLQKLLRCTGIWVSDFSTIVYRISDLNHVRQEGWLQAASSIPSRRWPCADNPSLSLCLIYLLTLDQCNTRSSMEKGYTTEWPRLESSDYQTFYSACPTQLKGK
jgi:hypothetical protein